MEGIIAIGFLFFVLLYFCVKALRVEEPDGHDMYQEHYTEDELEELRDW